MNKLICLECGYVASINYFDYIENDDPRLAPEYRRSYYCPMCGNVFVDDAEYCEECKQYFPKEVIKDNACPACRKLSDSNRGSAERGARMKDKTYTPDYISRPSDTIKESMEYSHKTIDDLWEEICLYDMAKLLADEIQIDERIAVALSKVLGSQPTFWMNLSNNYFAAKAQEEE